MDLTSNALSLAMEAHRRLRNAYGARGSSKPLRIENVVRVAHRLGIDENSAPDEFDALRVVPHDWSLEEVEVLKRLLEQQGERCCYERFPACERCPLIDLCTTGLSNMRQRDPARTAVASHDFMFPL